MTVICSCCNKRCCIANNNVGSCGVRYNKDGKLYLSIYGYPCAVHIDPVEKKPLYHFLPNTAILSIGTIGCNFKCQFCQNWDISQAVKPYKAAFREKSKTEACDIEDLSCQLQQMGKYYSPETLVNMAIRKGCKSIAFTYNEPTVFVELLAALPSVVLGFLGMVVLAPILQDVLGAATGLNLLNASLVLAIMSLPTICSVSEDALRAVPRSLREASLALGATRWETIVRVVVPAALSGIGTAIMLGMSRAMGETMVVLMAAGGAAMLPQSLLDPVRPMPASIAAEMAEAPFRSDHYYALFATGIVLFLMTLAFNMIASRIAEKHRQVGSASL